MKTQYYKNILRRTSLIIFQVVYIAALYSQPPNSITDSLELVKLYNATNGPNWDSTENWLTTAPINTWYGVKIENGNVTHIDLDGQEDFSAWGSKSGGNNLQDSLPDLNLPYLKYLTLTSNYNLSGTVPHIEAELLERIYLNACNLEGPLPEFTGTPNLKYLVLESNALLNGSLPSFSFNTNLQRIHISHCSLEGVIPESFTDLNNVNYLNLFDNNLSGTVPNFSGNTSLSTLNIQDNYFDSIPQFIDVESLPSSNYWAGLIIRDNKFTFDDIIPNLYIMQDTFLRYYIQKPVYHDTTIHIPYCSSYTIDLDIDKGITSSTYYWYADEVLVDSTFSSTFSIPLIEDEVTYTCIIKNSQVPELTLTSHPIRFLPPVINNCDCPNTLSPVSTISDSICYGDEAFVVINDPEPGYVYELILNGDTTGITHVSQGDDFIFEVGTLTTSSLVTFRCYEQFNESCSYSLYNTAFIYVSHPQIVASTMPESALENDGSVILTSFGGVPPYSLTYTPKRGLSIQNENSWNIDGLSAQYYSFTVTDYIGCTTMTNVLVDNPEKDRIGFPEATLLTPNSDGLNDLLIFDGLSNYPENELYIFDRYGNRLYYTQNYLNNWDGSYKGRSLATGTYFYTLLLSASEPITYKGHITIKNQ